jgi:hypothetical protein
MGIQDKQPTLSNVASLVSQIFGGELAGASTNQDRLGISITSGISLGAITPSKMKSNIWANEYVDLRSLLQHQKEDPVTLLITPGVINLQHAQKSKKPISIHQWTDAFLVFICIMLDKQPAEAPHLLKYLS